jgi:hypothetical protein
LSEKVGRELRMKVEGSKNERKSMRRSYRIKGKER